MKEKLRKIGRYEDTVRLEEQADEGKMATKDGYEVIPIEGASRGQVASTGQEYEENVKEDLYFIEGAIVGQHIKCSDAPLDKLESLLMLHEEADSEICGMVTSSKNKRYCGLLEKEIQICKSKMKE